MFSKPLLSVVIGSRNDGYPDGKGNYLLETTTNDLITNLGKINNNFEIIIIDYNPPKKKKSLFQDIKLKKIKNVHVKFIKVDEKFHAILKYHDKFFLNQETAFNVGIQRANGTFILTKNADTILNKEFYNLLRLNFFKEKDNAFYRCPRIDYDLEIFIKRQWNPIPPDTRINYACGDFILMSKSNWKKIRGYWENGEAYQDGCDSIVTETAKFFKINEINIEKCFIFKPKHNLIHEKRTDYKYYKLNIFILDQIFNFFRRVLIRLGLIKRRAKITARNGTSEKILMDIYVYDLIRKIKKNRIDLPLNKSKNWGLRDIKLKENIL